MNKKTIWQEIVGKTQNLDENLFIKASDVRIGDNVWEHNVVASIVRGKDKIVFNADNVSRWEARPDEQVMVTARIPSEDDLWCGCEGENKQKCFEHATYVSDHECDKCPVEKHHYHGGVCGKIVQIG